MTNWEYIKQNLQPGEVANEIGEVLTRNCGEMTGFEFGVNDATMNFFVLKVLDYLIDER